MIYIISEFYVPNKPKWVFLKIASKNEMLKDTLDSCEDDIAKESHKINESRNSETNKLFNDYISAVNEDYLSAKF